MSFTIFVFSQKISKMTLNGLEIKKYFKKLIYYILFVFIILFYFYAF